MGQTEPIIEVDTNRAGRSYCETALWADGKAWGFAEDAEWSREAEAQAVTICTRFAAVASLIEGGAEALADMGADRFGHLLYLTQQGHGSGFWDEDLGAIGERLTTAAHLFGEVYLEGETILEGFRGGGWPEAWPIAGSRTE